jgi:hypothetical protein
MHASESLAVREDKVMRGLRSKRALVTGGKCRIGLALSDPFASLSGAPGNIQSYG